LRPVRQTVTMVENYGKFMATAPHEVAGFLVLVCKAPINVVMVTSIDTKVVPQEPLENNASKQYMRGAVGQAIRGANPVEWKNIPGLCDLEDDLLGGSFRLGGKSLAIMDYHRGLQTHLEPVQVSDHWYEAAFGIEKLTPEVAQILAHHTKEVGPDKSHILLFSLGGKVTDPETKKDSDTAIECSTLNYWAIIEGRWKPSTDPVENAKRKKVVVDWSRELRKDLANHGLKETPHNFEGEEENLGGRPAFAENGARLQALKKQFDPQNIFSYNKKLNV